MNTLSWIVDGSFSTRLTLALLHFLWQGCAGGMVVVAGGWLLRGATARTRYILNVTTMLLMAACLPATFLMLDVPDTGTQRSGSDLAHESPAVITSDVQPVVPTTSQSLPATSGIVGSDEPLGQPDATTAPLPKSAEVALTKAPQAVPVPSLSAVLRSNAFATLARWVVVLYMAGVTLILGRLLCGVWGGDRLRKMAVAVTDPTLLEMVRQQAQRLGLKAAPTIAWCEQISVPVVVGIITPMILLPMAVANGLTPSQLQALLLHELSHIRRSDPVVNLLQRIVEAALFFHPVVWFVSRRISVERELAADDMVLAAGWDRPLYADALVRVAELAATISGSDIARRATVLGASGSNPSEFKTRVLRLLNEAPPPKLGLPRAGSAGVLLLLAVGGTIAWSQSAKPEPVVAPSQPVEADVEEVRTNAEEVAITGRVINAEGEPVAKAIVTYPFTYVTAKARATTGESNQAGVFRLLIKKSDIPRDLSSYDLHRTIWAAADGHAIGVAQFRGDWDSQAGALPAAGGPILIQLRKPTLSTFVIKTETGEPLSNATVIPRFVRVPNGDDPVDGNFGLYYPLPPALLNLVSRTTNADGRVVIDAVQPQQFKELEVTSKSHGTQPVRLTKQGEEEEFLLRSAGSLKGKLTGAPADSIRGVRLLFSTRDRYPNGIASVTTDQDGSFEVPAIAAGNLEVKVNNDPMQSWKLVYEPQIAVEPGKQNDVVLRLQKGVPVTGRLVVRGTDTGVAKALLSIWSRSFSNHDRPSTDERGEFQTFVIPGDDVVFQVISLGGDRDLTYPAMTQIKVTIPKDVDSFHIPDIEIPKARTWTGRLVDPTNQPVAGKYVQGFDQTTPLDHPARTDGDGAFKLTLRDDQVPNRWSALVKWNKPESDDKELVPAEVVSEVPFVLRVNLPSDTTTFKKPPLLLPDHWIVTAVGFDKNGQELVTASIQSFTTIRRWDLVKKKLISEIKLESDKHGRPLYEQTLKLSADCQKVIAATDAYVGVWDTTTGKLLNQLPIPKLSDGDTIGMLTCTPDLSVIVGNLTTKYSRLTLRYDAHTVVWNAVSDKAFRILTHPGQNDLISMSLSTDGKRLATTSGSGAFIWDTTSGKQLFEVNNDNTGRNHSDPEVNNQFSNNVWSVRFSPDGKLLAMGDTLGIKLLDSTTGNLVRQLEGPYRYSSGRSPGLVFSKDGQMVARLGTSNKTAQASPPESRLPTPLTPLITTVGTAGSTQYVIPIWSIPSGQKLFELHTNSNDAAFSDDGQQLAVAFSDLQQAVSVWQLNLGGADPDQTEGPGPEPRQDKVEQNGHYRGKTAAEFIDKFKPTWSEPKLGIQYGIALTKPQHQYHSGQQVPLVAFFRNASDTPLKIDMRPDYLGNAAKLINSKGTAIELENVPLVGHVPHYVETLQPGESVGPFYFNLALGENPRPGKQHWYPLYKKPVAGIYNLTHSVAFDISGPNNGDPATPGDITSGQVDFEIVDGN